LEDLRRIASLSEEYRKAQEEGKPPRDLTKRKSLPYLGQGLFG